MLTDDDKQWITSVVKTVVQDAETRLLTHMDEHFFDLEKTISRHDKGILAANIGINGVLESQAKQERQIRELMGRVEKLERGSKDG